MGATYFARSALACVYRPQQAKQGKRRFTSLSKKIRQPTTSSVRFGRRAGLPPSPACCSCRIGASIWMSTHTVLLSRRPRCVATSHHQDSQVLCSECSRRTQLCSAIDRLSKQVPTAELYNKSQSTTTTTTKYAVHQVSTLSRIRKGVQRTRAIEQFSSHAKVRSPICSTSKLALTLSKRFGSLSHLRPARYKLTLEDIE